MKYYKASFILLFIATFIGNAQSTGINTTSPKASLEIEASDSANPLQTDGLLIPRIEAFPATDPAADQNGMLVFLSLIDGNKVPGFYYWSDNSSKWIAANVYNETPTAHYIGELYGGGIVFFVYDNGNHGLIASLEEFTAPWCSEAFQSTLIGPAAQNHVDGAGNTAAIIAQDSTPGIAADICDSYVAGGYTDWYLPAAYELKALLDQSFIINSILNNDNDPTTDGINDTAIIGYPDSYHSSTESSDIYMIAIRVIHTIPYSWNKNLGEDFVRPIRSF